MRDPAGSSPAPSLILADGPLAAEATALAWVEVRLPRPGAGGELRPLRLVVPSRSLRQHLAAVLVRETGRALAGVSVQTLFGLAHELLARAGERTRGGDPLLAVLVRRLAGVEPALARPLGHLDDGLAGAAATVRDLLDAGLGGDQLAALGEIVAATAPATTADERARAHALLRVAAASAELAAGVGLDDPGRLYRRAAAALTTTPSLLPAGAVLVTGFADATGAATELLAALVRTAGADVIVDVPAGGEGLVPAADRFTRRLRTALSLAGARPRPAAATIAGTQGATTLSARATDNQLSLLATPTAATTPGIPTARPPGVARTSPGSPPEVPGTSGAPGAREPLGARADHDPSNTRAPGLTAFSADSPDAEAREVARRLRLALDAGATPERLLVVGRDLAPYRTALRRHLDRLGVPFSDLGGSGPRAPGALRLDAFTALLADGAWLPVERWLDLLAAADPTLPVADLRVAFAVLGCGRLANLAELDLDRRLGDRSHLVLPLRRGTPAGDEAAITTAGDADDELDDERRDEMPVADEGGAPPLATSPPAPPSLSGSRSGGRRGGQLRLDLDTGLDGSLQLSLPLPPPPLPSPPPAPAVAAGALTRRRVPAHLLRQLGIAARELCRLLAAWPDGAPFGEHRHRLGTLLTLLGWTAETSVPLTQALGRLDPLVPAALELSRQEVGELLRQSLAAVERRPLGGRGGGVQVLTATEARGRTADQLFLLGMLRGAFPRAVREDPLLADGLRRALRAVLPDLAVKTEGHDEERHLFASLLRAAPRVTLSWPLRTTGGEPTVASPLVDELRWQLGLTAQAVPSQLAPEAPGPHTAGEEALRAGLWHDRATAIAHWPAAITEGAVAEPAATATPRAAPVRLAEARARALTELDPDLSTADGRALRRRAGPYLGLIGPLDRADAADPRARPPGVTVLEQLATCPWRTYLRRVLGLVSPPDVVGALPEVDRRLLGGVVHAVLARIANQALGSRAEAATKAALGQSGDGPGSPAAVLASRLAAAPVPLAWPDPERLLALAREEAARLLAGEGRELPGLATALARAAADPLAIARADDERSHAAVLAAEIVTPLLLADGTPLDARADRLDRLADGRLRVTDWKTGKLPAPLGRAPRGDDPLLARLRSGQALQLPAYQLALAAARATAGRSHDPPATARFLALGQGLEDRQRELALEAPSPAIEELFQQTVATLLAAWRDGLLVPRLVVPSGDSEPPACRFCEVHEACHRGDSGVRARIARWLREHPQQQSEPDAGDGDEADAERPSTLRSLWALYGVTAAAADGTAATEGSHAGSAASGGVRAGGPGKTPAPGATRSDAP